MSGKRTNGRPLPDGHPFKGGCIIFGSTIPEAWKKRFSKKTQGSCPEQSAMYEEEQPSTKLEPVDSEVHD